MAPDTNILQEAYIPTHRHACKVVSVCTRAELAGIANMFRGCAFNRTSYETSCSSFAHRGSHTTALQQARSTDGLESHHAPQKGVKCICSFLLSHHIPKWNDHVCTAIICFLPEDAGNSCPGSLNARCRLSLAACLMSPVG